LALNFPNSPVDGQIFYDPTSGAKYVWVAASSKWKSMQYSSTIVAFGYQTANAAYDTTNAAFAMANAAFSIQNVDFTLSNSAFAHANASYDSANSNWAVQNAIYSVANSAFDSANNVGPQIAPTYNTANAAFAVANAALPNVSNAVFAGNLRVTGNLLIGMNTVTIKENHIISAEYYRMNTANHMVVIPDGNRVNTLFSLVNVSFDTANASYNSANNVGPQIAPTYNTANAAYNHANAAHTIANAAYAHANTKFSSSGGSISGAVEINADLTVRGNTRFIDQQTLAVGDPLIYLAANNYTSDIVDIGFVANYVNTTSVNVHTGLFRSSATKEYYLFQGYDKEPINNYIDPTGNNISMAVLNSSVRTSNLILGGANAINWITSLYNSSNADYVLTNAAFAAANSKVATVAGTSGRITSSGTTGITLDLATAGPGAGSYSSGISALTLDAYGRVTAVTSSAGYVTSSGVTSVSGTGTVSGLTLTGTVTTTGSLTLGGTLSASIIDNISDEHRLFNNMGDSHGAITSFDATNPSYNFGFRFIQGSTNGPGVNGAGQYYSLYAGLGNNFLATGAGSYGMQMAFPRNVTTPYIAIRYNENNTLGSWQKISAGYADTVGTITSGQVTTALGYTPASLAGATFTGLLIGQTATTSGTSAGNDTGSMSIRGDGTKSAHVSFHRTGAYAINMGLDTDNVFRFGGWSDGAATYRLQLAAPAGQSYLNGSLAATLDFRAPIFYDTNNTAYYVDPNSTSHLLTAKVTHYKYGNISYISKCGAGCMMILQDGKLYTASGTSGGPGNHTTGRGLNGQVPVYGLDKFKAVTFPNETTNPIQCGTDGYNRSWALFANGNLYTWGLNNSGQLGLGNTTAYGFPTLSTTNVTAVYDHPTTSQRYPDHNKLIIRKTDGYLYATGYNAQGNLGVGDTTVRTSWTQLTALGTSILNVWNMGATWGCTVVQKTDHTIWVCGFNNQGLLGNGNTTQQNSFINVTINWGGGSGYVLTKVIGGFGGWNGGDYGEGWMGMLLDNGTTTIFRTSGRNSEGQLGDGTTTARSTPITPNVGTGRIADVASFGDGAGGCLVLKADGNLYTWGYNGHGQLGNGTTTNNPTPTINQTGVAAILSDGCVNHVQSLTAATFIRKTADNALYCTGFNTNAQLGVGDTTNRSTYTKVRLPNDFVVSSLGWMGTTHPVHTFLALSTDGRLYAWGYNAQNSLAADSTINGLVPHQITPFLGG
jgi:alpha-tubulin suppressor-like RCC1 family protein